MDHEIDAHPSMYRPPRGTGLEQIPFDEPTDLVAMNVEAYTARRA